MKNMRSFVGSTLLAGLLVAVIAALATSPPRVVNAGQDVTGTAAFPIRNPIDKFVLAKLQSEKIEPSGTCTDDEFLRRVHLDLVGNIPTLAETKAFLADHSADKRAKLVDKLLKSERYGQHWSAMWSDLLREHTNGRAQEGTERGSYHKYIVDSLNRNQPYDLFTRELIDAVGTADEDPATNFYLRDQDNRVETANNISTVFMGTRMACAQCHDHPFDKWTQTDFHNLMAFFGRTNVRVDPYASLLRVENLGRLPADAKPILEPYFKEAHEKMAAEKAAYKKGTEVSGAQGMGMEMGFYGIDRRAGQGRKADEGTRSQTQSRGNAAYAPVVVESGRAQSRRAAQWRVPHAGRRRWRQEAWPEWRRDHAGRVPVGSVVERLKVRRFTSHEARQLRR